MDFIIGKPRPRRVFEDENGKFYMIINGKRKYLKPVVRKGKELKKLHEVQREVRQKIKGRIKLNYQTDKNRIPKRPPRNWKKQNKTKQTHRPKNDMRISDIVNAIHRIGRPEDNDPTIFNQYATPIKYIEDKRMEAKPSIGAKEIKEMPAIEDKREEVVITTIKNPRGRPKGVPNKAKITEIKEEPIADDTIEEKIPKTESKSLINAAKKAWRDLFKNSNENTDVYEDDNNEEKQDDDEYERIRGKGKILKALYNDQIEETFKDDPRFTGTYAVDEIKDIPKQIPQAFVINTAPIHAKDGDPKFTFHWQAVYISPDSVEFYDSYGDEPTKEVIDQLIQVIHSWKLPILLKFKVNRVAGQNNKSETCGYFACRFIDERLNGVPFDQATRFRRPDNYSPVEHQENEGEQALRREFTLI